MLGTLGIGVDHGKALAVALGCSARPAGNGGVYVHAGFDARNGSVEHALYAGSSHHAQEGATGDRHHVEAQGIAHLDHSDVVTVGSHKLGGLGTNFAAAANHNGARLNGNLAQQNILGKDSVLQAWNGQLKRLGARGNNHGVGCEGLNGSLVNLNAQVHGHAHGCKFGAQGAYVGSKLALAGGVGGRAELATQGLLRFKDLDLVAALSCGLSGLQTSRATTNNHDLLGVGLGNLGQVVFVLATHARIYQAGNLGVNVERELTTLQAADALTCLAKTASARLGGHVRIGERATAHSNGVCYTHLNEGIGHLGVVHAVGEDNRNVNRGANLLGAVHVGRVWREHGGNNLVGRLACIHAV